MTNDDLNQIQNVLRVEINTALDSKLAGTEKRLRTEIGSTEKRLRGEMGSLKVEIAASEKRVITEIVDFVHDQLMPLIDDKADKTDIESAARRTDYLGNKVGEHDVRLENIESIPVVAHQLKVKKAK